VKVKYVHSEHLDQEQLEAELSEVDGILVAPGFGGRGIEGKILAIAYARENKIPFFGICLGMQCAVIEFGRNVLGLKDAHSTEMNPKTNHPVIDIMSNQRAVTNLGGTMRLGAYPCKLDPDSKVFQLYKETMISERHRHRFEFNNDYRKDYNKAGIKTVGIYPNENLVEIVELDNHPWFVGVQYHPEYKSTVANPHPLFVGFIAAMIKARQK
jgi:CTP synthase